MTTAVNRAEEQLARRQVEDPIEVVEDRRKPGHPGPVATLDEVQEQAGWCHDECQRDEVGDRDDVRVEQ